MEASQLNTRGHAGNAACFDEPHPVSGKHAAAANRLQSRNHQGKPSNSQRRHSLYFSNSHTPRVDPRPLGDKAYINSCIRQLISFLSSRGFDSALSPRTLAAPTAKEFAALCLFLFRQADENFKFGSKTEDDVPTVFKQLRYPFQISKSALYAVGSPHTWPSLLTALSWLVQMYIYEEEAGRSETKVILCPFRVLHHKTGRTSCLLFQLITTCALQVQSVEPVVTFFKYASSAYRVSCPFNIFQPLCSFFHAFSIHSIFLRVMMFHAKRLSTSSRQCGASNIHREQLLHFNWNRYRY